MPLMVFGPRSGGDVSAYDHIGQAVAATRGIFVSAQSKQNNSDDNHYRRALRCAARHMVTDPQFGPNVGCDIVFGGHGIGAAGAVLAAGDLVDGQGSGAELDYSASGVVSISPSQGSEPLPVLDSVPLLVLGTTTEDAARLGAAQAMFSATGPPESTGPEVSGPLRALVWAGGVEFDAWGGGGTVSPTWWPNIGAAFSTDKGQTVGSWYASQFFRAFAYQAPGEVYQSIIQKEFPNSFNHMNWWLLPGLSAGIRIFADYEVATEGVFAQFSERYIVDNFYRENGGGLEDASGGGTLIVSTDVEVEVERGNPVDGLMDTGLDGTQGGYDSPMLSIGDAPGFGGPARLEWVLEETISLYDFHSVSLDLARRFGTDPCSDPDPAVFSVIMAICDDQTPRVCVEQTVEGFYSNPAEHIVGGLPLPDSGPYPGGGCGAHTFFRTFTWFPECSAIEGDGGTMNFRGDRIESFRLMVNGLDSDALLVDSIEFQRSELSSSGCSPSDQAPF
jgi:hypothetical protein